MSNCLCDAWLLVPHSLCYHLLAKAAYTCWFSSSFSPLSLFSINYHNELERHRELGCEMYAQTSRCTRQLASVTLVTQQCLLAKCQLQVWFRDEKKGAFSFVKNVKINTISTWILISGIESKCLVNSWRHCIDDIAYFGVLQVWESIHGLLLSFLESYEDFPNSFFCHSAVAKAWMGRIKVVQSRKRGIYGLAVLL